MSLMAFRDIGWYRSGCFSKLEAMNRREGLNLLVRAATESVQQWARDVKGMRMGILIVIHTFGSDLKWHPHIHLVVTGGGLSLDGARWVATDPRFLMHHGGLKKRWKYQVVTRMKEAHKEGKWRFPESASYLKLFPCFAAMLNKLWKLTWWAYIGASLADPRFSVQYIGRYSARTVAPPGQYRAGELCASSVSSRSRKANRTSGNAMTAAGA